MSARDVLGSVESSKVVLDEDSHVYRVDGRVIPGVTRLLDPLCSWEHVPVDVLDRKSKLGRAVHLATEFYDRGTLDESSLSDEVAGYLRGWIRFREETGATAAHRERLVYHDQLGFAGTLDWEGDYCGDLTIIDIKSGTKQRTHGVQIAGYALARRHEMRWSSYPKRRAVYLSPDGRYEAPPFTDPSDYQMFISMLNVHNWRNPR